MGKKINIAELLKDCPKGMELDCTIYDNVEFEGISDNKDWPIAISVEGYPEVLNPYGCISYRDYTKCVIFPKGKTTWEGFAPPCKFKDGDIVFSGVNLISILKEIKPTENFHCYVSIDMYGKLYIDEGGWTTQNMRFATEDEKETLFKVIKYNGYKWNPETKTLEKLIVPKFKVGDRIRLKGGDELGVITQILENCYTVENKPGVSHYPNLNAQDNYELVPNKFNITTLKPFDKVLVRGSDKQSWYISFFSHCNKLETYKYSCINGVSCAQCIPYEGNEHLLDTTNDCNEFYKTWEE